MIRRPPQTHIDPYEGEIITTDGKPPVNAKLTNFKMYGKSVQNGTPTPESPVPIQSVAHNTSITSCGKNLFDASKITSSQYTVEEGGRIIKREGYITDSGYYFRFLPNTTYRISYKGILSAGASGGIYGSISAFHGSTAFFSLTSGQLSGDINRTFTTPSQIPNDGLLDLYFYGPSNSGGNVYGYIYEDLVLTYEGVADREWQSYIGSTTQLLLIGAPNAPVEWIGQPISLMSLPDGTADEYRAEEGVVIKRVRKIEISNATSPYTWRFDESNTNADQLYVRQPLPLPPTGGVIQSYSNILPSSDSGLVNTFSVAFSTTDGMYIFVRLPLGTLSERSQAGVHEWINSQIATHGNIIFITKYIEPITTPVTAQPTPKSVYAQPNNIYANTTPQPTISCGVRKLGNRPFIPTNLKDELGNFLVDENGNNIGGLY